MRGIAFLDVETTGLENCHAVDIAILVVDGDREIYRFNTLIKPPIPIEPEAMAIHHITEEMVADKPTAAEIYPEVNRALELADVIAGHNISFDVDVLHRDWPLAHPKKEMKLIDTCRLSRHIWPDIPSYSLQAVRYRFNIPAPDSRDAHTAAFDCVLCWELMKRFVQERGIPLDTLQYWVDLSASPVRVLRFQFGKYIGELVADVARKDKHYLCWLLNQPWLRTQHPDLDFTIRLLLKGR